MQRPTSVTVAAWIIIALAAAGLVGSFSSLLRPILSQLTDPQVGVTVTALPGSMIQIAVVVSAVFMHTRWSRPLFCFMYFFGQKEVAAQDVKLAHKCSQYSAQIAGHLFRLRTSLDELRDPDSTRFHDHEAAVQALRPLGKEFHDLVGER